MRAQRSNPVVHIVGGVLRPLRPLLQCGIQVVVREGIKALMLGLVIAGAAGMTRADALQRVYLSLF